MLLCKMLLFQKEKMKRATALTRLCTRIKINKTLREYIQDFGSPHVITTVPRSPSRRVKPVKCTYTHIYMCICVRTIIIQYTYKIYTNARARDGETGKTRVTYDRWAAAVRHTTRMSRHRRRASVWCSQRTYGGACRVRYSNRTA